MRFALLSAILAVTAAQQNIQDPIKDFCRRHRQQTCIIDSKLYLDGGMVYYGGSVGNGSIAQTNNALVWEDVSNSKNDNSFPIQYSNLTKGPNIPYVSGGVLWPDNDNKLFYLFGGEYAEIEDAQGKDSQGIDLWLYDVLYNTWNKTTPDSTQNSVKWPAFGAGTVTAEGIAYYYGGYLTNKSTSDWSGLPLMLNGLLSYDMNTRVWQNTTYDTTPRAEGSLHYIPASQRGMLVYFGGLETNVTTGVASHANMSNIQLFDIANNRWFTQTASGDVPQPRHGFCAGVVWAKDKSSYNIYFFGGFAANGTGLGDVYILSLPSFQWMLVYPTPEQYVFPRGKGWSSCNVIRESQLLVIGGYYTNNSITECDVPIIGGQHAMLLGQENVEQGAWWHAPMDNVTGYRVPDELVTRIGGDVDGHATSTAPARGWQTSDLSVYMSSTFSAKSRSATRPIPTTSTTLPAPTTSAPAQPTYTPTHHRTNTGAIAGGTVGGVVALIGIIALVLLCLRSRRRKRNAHEQVQTEYTQAPGPPMLQTANKSVATGSVSQGSTLNSPMHQSSAHSPQGSPPPQSHSWYGDMHTANSYDQGSTSPHHQSGEWAQQSNYSYQQTYYPPPPEPAQSSKRQHAHTMSVEMPNVRSPAAVAEMPQMKSPPHVPRIQE